MSAPAPKTNVSASNPTPPHSKNDFQASREIGAKITPLQAHQAKDYPKYGRKDHGGNYYIPCRQPLPSRQWKSCEGFYVFI
jgi:hypothetical protein